MSESDLEFFERYAKAHGWAVPDRLLSLARRGAETQWRPMKEYDNSGHDNSVLAQHIDGRRVYRDGFAECDLEYYTHYIPLSALGEPE